MISFVKKIYAKLFIGDDEERYGITVLNECPICKEYFKDNDFGCGIVTMKDKKDRRTCNDCAYIAGIIAGVRGENVLLPPLAIRFLENNQFETLLERKARLEEKP